MAVFISIHGAYLLRTATYYNRVQKTKYGDMPYAHNQFACSADCLHSVLHRRDSILAHFACARLQVDKRQTRAGAVIAVAIFGQEAPDYFGVFDVAFLTLFYVTAGEPWPDELQRLNSDGSANWVTGGFTLAFTIVVHLIVLEVIFLKRTLWFDCAGRGNGWWRHIFWTCLLSEFDGRIRKVANRV